MRIEKAAGQSVKFEKVEKKVFENSDNRVKNIEMWKNEGKMKRKLWETCQNLKNV